MAHRMSKTKRPAFEDKQVKHLNKIAERSLDDKTVETLLSLVSKGVVRSIDYPVSGGKEAIVFRATSKTGFAAVKVYKYETSTFRHMAKYIEGDPRFNVRHTQRQLVREWAKKEFANLRILYNAGVRVPAPMAQKDNVVVMEFLGVGGVQSALLEEVVVENPKEMLEDLLEQTRRIYAAGLVHADLSSFNIIIHDGRPYIIDVGQAVLLKHPLAEDFLEKDVCNLLGFFAKLGARKDFAEALAFVKGGKE